MNRLILCPGIPRSGTTSLWTLLNENNIINGLNSPEKIRILASNNYKLVPYFSKQYIRKYNLKNHHKEELIQYGLKVNPQKTKLRVSLHHLRLQKFEFLQPR